MTCSCHYHTQRSIRKSLKSSHCSAPQTFMTISFYFFQIYENISFIVATINKCVKQKEIRKSYLAWPSYNERKRNCERSKIAAVFSKINTSFMPFVTVDSWMHEHASPCFCSLCPALQDHGMIGVSRHCETKVICDINECRTFDSAGLAQCFSLGLHVVYNC